MPADLRQMNIRLSPTERAQLEALAERLSAELGFPVTMTDAIRHVVAEASTGAAFPAGVEPTAANLYGVGRSASATPVKPRHRKARANAA